MADILRCRAEAVAWPFVAPAPFRHASHRIHTKRLLPSFQLRLQQLGLGRVEEVVRWAWHDGDSLTTHLQRHAKQQLYHNGSNMRLRPNHQQPGREILAWRWFSLALPPLLLTSATMPSGVPAPPQIQVLDPTLIPRGPVAHLHLHLGAIYPFELVWSYMASTVRFDGVHDAPVGINDVNEWRGWLIRALLARRVLAAHIHHRSALGTCPVCVLSNIDVYRALGELLQGHQSEYDKPREARLARLAREVRFRRRPIRQVSDVWHNDPLGGDRLLPEAAFMAASLAYLDEQAQTKLGDEDYARLWTQYLRVKCMLYRHIVTDPAEAGLSTFSRRYDRIDQYVGSGLETLAPTLSLDEPELALKAVEVRSAPPRDAGVFRQKARSVRTCSKQSGIEMGWVFHFIRDRGHDDKFPRYARIFRTHGRAAAKLERCVQYWPDLLREIRGLDLASEELQGPLWLAIPSLSQLRVVSRHVARQKRGLQPLRLTLHVGEDFRHIASGLRAIHEPFVWKLIERGDRLGHALALGVDVIEWCKQHPYILQPRLERILDLAWILDFVSHPNRSFGSDTNIHRLQHELDRQLYIWAGVSCSWQDAVKLHRLLGKPDALTQIGYPHLISTEPPSSHKPLQLLRLLLYSRLHQSYADEIIEIPTEPDAALLAQIQRHLAHLIARWQVTIEVNPSSNLLIGALKQPLDQPMFRLRPVEPHVPHALPIAISTDDPITFATRLADEYAYAWAGMVVSGNAPPTYARQWLDEAADAAWRARFTLPIE
jgi:hypothetical protein